MKWVLDLNFAPIKGSVFLIFFKKVKFVVPYPPSCASPLKNSRHLVQLMDIRILISNASMKFITP
jgi:hypothetical protein